MSSSGVEGHVMTATATTSVVSERPLSLISRWDLSIDHVSSKATNRERFYWTLIIQIGMEDILRPMHRGSFSGYLERGEDSDIVSVILAGIRKDAMALDDRQKRIVMKRLVGHLIRKIEIL